MSAPERISKPRRPSGLGSAGRRLWDGLSETYEFRADELPLLAEMCHLADDMNRLRRELKDAPLTVAGSKGQQVAHPLRLELHRCSTRYESLAKTLAVPDPESAGADSSWAGRNLARARWG